MQNQFTTKIEIIANQTVEEELLKIIDIRLPDFHYSLIRNVYGKGFSGFCFGTDVWPDQNFFLFSYCTDEERKIMEKIVAELHSRPAKEELFYIAFPAKPISSPKNKKEIKSVTEENEITSATEENDPQQWVGREINSTTDEDYPLKR